MVALKICTIISILVLAACSSTKEDYVEEQSVTKEYNDKKEQKNKEYKNKKVKDEKHKNKGKKNEEEMYKIIGTTLWYPYQMMDENGIGYGASYEILNIIFDELNVKYEKKAKQPFQRQLKALEKGDVDIHAGLYFTKERDKKYLYTEAFSEDAIHVFVRKGNEFPLESYEDLIGKVGSIPTGATYGDEFEMYREKLTLKQIDKEGEQLEHLVEGRVDYYISSYHDVQRLKKELKVENEIIALEKPLVTNKVYFVMSKKSSLTKDIDKFNEILIRLKNEGKIDEILNTYEGKF